MKTKTIINTDQPLTVAQQQGVDSINAHSYMQAMKVEESGVFDNDLMVWICDLEGNEMDCCAHIMPCGKVEYSH